LADWNVSWRDENDAAASRLDSVQTLGQLRELLKGR